LYGVAAAEQNRASVHVECKTSGSRLRGGQEESDNSRAHDGADNQRGRTTSGEGKKPGNRRAVTVKRSDAGTGSRAAGDGGERVHEAKPMSGDTEQ
jgi:hypothetical protein